MKIGPEIWKPIIKERVMSNTTDTWQARLFLEHDQLCEQVSRLRGFITSPEFSELAAVDQDDLREQLGHMTSYAHVLTRRVARIVTEQ